MTDRVFDIQADLDAGIEAAAAAVAAGDCVVMPTDTVYGIGAAAMKRTAVKKLLDAKERGEDMPPPVLIAEPSMLRAFTADVPFSARKLAENFWPGPLTLILKAQKSMKIGTGANEGTVAVRVPDHEGARALLRRTGPMAVSSANISGQPAATTCAEAEEQLADTVAVYLDAGATPGNTPSTIVDFTRFTGGTIVREGVLAFEELKKVALRLKDIERPEPEELPAEEAQAELPAPEAESTPEESSPDVGNSDVEDDADER